MNAVFIFLTSALVSFAAIFWIKKIAIRFKIGSLPSPRKLHKDFKPLMGGLGIALAILAGFLVALLIGIGPDNFWQKYRYFWWGFTVIIFTGLFDDIRGISSWIKFSGEGIAAALLILGGCKIQSFGGPLGGALNLGIFSIPFTFLWIIFLINAINLMDGLDGLAGGVSLIIAAGMILVGVWIKNDFIFLLSLMSVGGLLGFLKFNYYPASIFMGEVGSLQLGYLMAFFSIEAMKMAGSHQIYFLVSLVIFAVPMTDTLVAFLRRLGQGKSPFLADKEHIHHRLLRLGLAHLQTVWLMYFFTILYVSLGLLMFYFEGWLSLFLFAMAFILALFWLYRLGYVETRLSLQNLIYQLQKSMAVKTRAPLHFNRIWHRLLLVIVDIITINIALYAMHWLKFRSGLLPGSAEFRPVSEYFVSPVFLLLLLAWIFIFFVNNLYHLDWDISRSEKGWRVSKVITFGILLVGFLTIDFQQIINRSQILSLTGYWIFMIVFVNVGRLLVIEIEKRFKIFEYSPRKSIIVGCNEFGKKALSDIQYNPHLIYDVVGFISKKERVDPFSGLPVLGTYTNLPDLIHRHKIEEVIIAIPESSSQDFINIVSLCEPQGIKIKTIPGKEQILPGRQFSLANHAFAQIFANHMALWQWILKRLFDVIIAILLMIILSPFLLFTALFILLHFKKSVIVKVPILGKNGIPFNMYVFRLTRKNYHFEVNPVYLGTMPLANEKSRYLNFLFRYRFYKLSQLINVLLGDMSIIGPRPEPMEWYQKYSSEINFLHRRIMVRPGLTGLAQVKYHYELSRKLLQEWVKYDMYYTENLSLRMDMSIMVRTILMVFVKKYKDSSADLKKNR